MKKLYKGSLNVLGVYLTSVFLFTFFLIAPINMKNTYLWITIYSIIFFAFLLSFMYKRLRETGYKENRQGEEAEPHPLKGLIYGIMGFLPLMAFEMLYFIIYNPQSDSFWMKIFHIAFRCLFGPLYFIIRGLDYTWFAYIAATMAVPLIAAVSYMAGHYDFALKNVKDKLDSDDEDFLK
jgi:hypothetical protein